MLNFFLLIVIKNIIIRMRRTQTLHIQGLWHYIRRQYPRL